MVLHLQHVSRALVNHMLARSWALIGAEGARRFDLAQYYGKKAQREIEDA